MSKDDGIEKQLQEWRDQNTFFRIFNPDAYNLSESFDYIQSYLKADLQQPLDDEEREQIIYEAFSKICMAENKNMNFIELLADLLYAKNRLEIHLSCILKPCRKPWWRRRPYRT